MYQHLYAPYLPLSSGEERRRRRGKSARDAAAKASSWRGMLPHYQQYRQAAYVMTATWRRK